MSLAHDSVGLVILWSSITSAGVGAAFAAIPNLIVVAVDEHQTGEATGGNTVMRNIGSAVGAQVAGTIIATHVLANGLAENAGFTIAFLISAVGAVIAAISVLLIPGHRSRQPAAELRKQASVAARAPA
jgi:MFS family permease